MCYPWTSRLAEGAPTDELRAATRDVGSRQLNPLLHRLAVDRSNGRRVWLDQGGAVREHRDAARGDGDLSSEQFALLELLSLVLLDEGRHDEALEHPERVVAWPGAGRGGWRGSHLLRKTPFGVPIRKAAGPRMAYTGIQTWNSGYSGEGPLADLPPPPPPASSRPGAPPLSPKGCAA